MGFSMTTYWNQWNRSELMSMHGIDQDAYHNDNHNDNHNDRQSDNENEADLSLESLGMSWRDFM